MNPLSQRQTALCYARSYGHRGKILMCQAWLERAAKIKPLDEMIVWRFKQAVGVSNFLKLDWSKVKTEYPIQ